MSIYKDIKNAVTSTVNMVVDKTSSQAQKSRLVTVMRTEEKRTNQLYIQLGQYLYENLRDVMPEDIAQTCNLIDASKERMARAQAKYREVIQQELVNREISKAEARENFVKIKEPIVAKAKDTAVKVKDTAFDTASKVKSDTSTKVEELKRAVSEKATERKLNKEKAETTENTATEDNSVSEEISDSIIDIKEESDVNEAFTQSIDLSDVDTVEELDAIDMNPTPAEYSEPVTEEVEETSAYDVKMTIETPISTSSVSEVAEVSEDPTPKDKPLDQEFQRSVPVDIISETEFEENEPEVKPLDKTNPLAKAMKLRKIISKKNESEE